MPKTIFVPSRKRGQKILLHDHLSDLEVAERIDRICDAKIAAKQSYLSRSEELAACQEHFMKQSTVPMIGSAEDDEAMDLIHANLASLGMPVLATIPPLPSEDEILKAMADTDEINETIQRARKAIEKEKE